MGKTIVFFDVQNLYHSSKSYSGGKKISYKDLLSVMVKDRELDSAYAYVAHKNGKENAGFYKVLESLNIKVRSKRVVIKQDGAQEKVIPAHFHVELTTDVWAAVDSDEKIDTVILATGDGEYGYMIDALIQAGINVEVWSFEKSTSRELKKNAKFVEIPSSCLTYSMPTKETVPATA
jgi:uncharacterized LabA/DUF88 family protein